jgi:hypothetical protein
MSKEEIVGIIVVIDVNNVQDAILGEIMMHCVEIT